MGNDRDSQDPGAPARKKPTTLSPIELLKRLDWRWGSTVALIAGAIWGLAKRAERIETQLADVGEVPLLVVRLNLLESRVAVLETTVAELRRFCGGHP